MKGRISTLISGTSVLVVDKLKKKKGPRRAGRGHGSTKKPVRIRAPSEKGFLPRARSGDFFSRRPSSSNDKNMGTRHYPLQVQYGNFGSCRRKKKYRDSPGRQKRPHIKHGQKDPPQNTDGKAAGGIKKKKKDRGRAALGEVADRPVGKLRDACAYRGKG